MHQQNKKTIYIVRIWLICADLGVEMLGKFRETIKPAVMLAVKPIANLGVNPNFFSALAVPLSLIAGYFIVLQNFVPAFIFALLAVSIDLFDGTVARLQKKESLFGNYFETMVDKVVEIILFISCAFLFPVASATALGFSMLVSYAKPRAGLVIISDNRDWPGVGEHSERMLLLLVGIALSIFGIRLDGISVLEIALWLIAAITAIGSIQRVLFAKKLIEEAKKKGKILPYLKKKK